MNITSRHLIIVDIDFFKKFNDTYVVCPGSTSLPRGNDSASYLIIEFDKNNEPIFTFKEL